MTIVLRAVSCFSTITIISRHQSYRQSYTLALEHSEQLQYHSYGTGRPPGTTVTVKNLFHCHPPRRANSLSNMQKELNEIHTISLGIALSSPVKLLCVINGDREVFECNAFKDWDDWKSKVLMNGLKCELSPWLCCVFKQNGHEINISVCHSTAPRNYFFICISPFICGILILGQMSIRAMFTLTALWTNSNLVSLR